ncbi:MAG: HAMP domain-containing sensor histidine kinase [Patescibacteria group bacterium]
MGILGFVFVTIITRPITKLTDQIRDLDVKSLNSRISSTSSSEELVILTKSFNELLERVNKTLTREQQFIGDVAHEIKTPLSSLQTTIEVGLRNNRSIDDYKAILRNSLSDANRIKKSLNQILDLAWTESRHENHKFETLNLSEILDDVLEIATKLASQKDIKVTSEVEKNIYVEGLKDRLGQMFINIIENAINYTDKGSIVLTTKVRNNKVEIIITDTGRGIPNEDLDKIFDRFVRSTSSKNTKGTGIGLPIAQSIAKLHGGEIKVVSNLGSGSSFTVILPHN